MKLEQLRREWDSFGRRDPCWAILTDASKANNRWDVDEFFGTARGDVAGVLEELSQLGLNPARRRALDFGCGIGRLTQALADHFETCLGIDIAPSMIAQARRHNRHAERCRYTLNDDDDLALLDDDSFDFVLSLLVLQHVPPEASRRYLEEFVRVLSPGGVAVFQLPSERVTAPGLTVVDRPLPDSAWVAKIEVESPLPAVTPGDVLPVRVRVENASLESWPAVGASGDGPMALHLGNHWLDASGAMLRMDDARAPLPADVGPGSAIELALHPRAPEKAGHHLLELDMVQEGVSWFAARGSPTTRIPVEVRRPGALRRLRSRLLRRSRKPEQAPRMEMHGVRQPDVEATLTAAGGRVVSVREDGFAGPSWRSLRYFVQKPR